MKSIFRFVQGAGNLGLGSVLLSIILLGISVEEHFRDKDIPAYWLMFTAIASFSFGAYRAWMNEHESLVRELEKNSKPLLKIELGGTFFDVSKIPNQNALQAHVYAYLRVTNLSSPETLIKDGTLVMTVEGSRYKGVGDDSSTKGNALEHISDFRLNGEITTADVFGNSLSPFPRLLSVVNAEKPIRRGITQEGFFVFTFTDLMDWNRENPYTMPVNDAVFTLRDSFDGAHTLEVTSLNIPQGTLTNSGRFPLTGLFSR
jgi:hypothetical protein